MRITCDEVYDESLPFKCGNLDCGAVLEAPFTEAVLASQLDGRTWHTHVLLCPDCYIKVIAAAQMRELEFDIVG